MKTGNHLRGLGSTGRKLGAISMVSIVGKNIGIAPNITKVISEISQKVPDLLKVTSEIPGLQQATDTVINNVPYLNTISNDLHTLGNIGLWTFLFTLIYWTGKHILRGRKGRVEAFGSAALWGAASLGLFNEVFQYLQGNARDVLEWMPMKFFKGLSPDIRNSVIENSEAVWAIMSGTFGAVTSSRIIPNLKIVKNGPSKKKGLLGRLISRKS